MEGKWGEAVITRKICPAGYCETDSIPYLCNFDWTYPIQSLHLFPAVLDRVQRSGWGVYQLELLRSCKPAGSRSFWALETVVMHENSMLSDLYSFLHELGVRMKKKESLVDEPLRKVWTIARYCSMSDSTETILSFRDASWRLNAATDNSASFLSSFSRSSSIHAKHQTVEHTKRTLRMLTYGQPIQFPSIYTAQFQVPQQQFYPEISSFPELDVSVSQQWLSSHGSCSWWQLRENCALSFHRIERLAQ